MIVCWRLPQLQTLLQASLFNVFPVTCSYWLFEPNLRHHTKGRDMIIRYSKRIVKVIFPYYDLGSAITIWWGRVPILLQVGQDSGDFSDRNALFAIQV
jgi:hypothetical protein